MKFLILPDSFKGSITSSEFCQIAEEAILSRIPEAKILSYPICDGGEGSIECLSTLFHGKIMTAKATDGNLFLKTASFAYNNECAFIAVSETSGLAKTMIKDPSITTTVGMGEQILQAKHLGKKKIVLCLGGSSTNDGGAGLVYALGGKFYDKEGQSFLPTGGTLRNIAKIDLDEFNKNIEGMEFVALCDVTNPLIGPSGCSYTFAKQKGAKKSEMQDVLEDNMLAFTSTTSFLGVDPMTKGTGAAGGLGYCVLAFLKGKLVSGINFILDNIGFDEIATDADFIITGEGKFDETSMQGKVISGILTRAERIGKKVVVFCGEGIPSDRCVVRTINDPTLSLTENINATASNLKTTIEEFVTTI